MSGKAEALLRHFDEFTIIKLLHRTSIGITMIVLIPNVPAKYIVVSWSFIFMRMCPDYMYGLFAVCIVPCSKIKEMSSC